MCLRDRFKVFECAVTACVLYASGTWTITSEEEGKFSTVGRRLLRWMVHVPRRHEETWVECIQRAPHRSDEFTSALEITDWAMLQRIRKWRPATKAPVSTDGRWMSQLLAWKPLFRAIPFGSVRLPTKRWDDDLVQLAGGDWYQSAHDGALWNKLGAANVSSTAWFCFICL